MIVPKQLLSNANNKYKYKIPIPDNIILDINNIENDYSYRSTSIDNWILKVCKAGLSINNTNILISDSEKNFVQKYKAILNQAYIKVNRFEII
ncbi:hypothetical protein SAMN02745176_02142 [Lutispora thermophila DSM 19022]|uniref:Uncharacterized protein n=1 Tax=Lutispora thermophila DSM 19022 TaxID=1122184 RepID=A0A1M6FX16_9FIRM|nr:hypothetical protein SAMN02745176_02142 [Lutispora thermophila DSM 19022]